MKIIIGIFVGSVIAVISALFGAWLNRNSAKKAVELSFGKIAELLKRQEFFKAATKFRAAFVKSRREMGFLGNEPGREEVYKILHNSMFEHKEAVIEFEAILDKPERDSFKSAWINFSGEDYEAKGYKKRYYQYNIHEGATGLTGVQIRELAIDNIKKLLESANQQHK